MTDRLLHVLSHHIGADRGVIAEALAQAVYGDDAGPAEQRRVRREIEQLRRQGEHICGDPQHGYYVAAMKRVSLPDLAGQLRIRMEDRHE